MYTRNSTLIVFVILILAELGGHTALAGTVHIYGGDFNLPIPANPDETKGWMDDAIIDVPDHLDIFDIDVVRFPELSITTSSKSH